MREALRKCRSSSVFVANNEELAVEVIEYKLKLDDGECDFAISKTFRKRDSVGRFEARSFTVDAGTSSPSSLGRSALPWD